jgi:hypothetical protein
MPEREVRSVIVQAQFPQAAVNKMVCAAWYESNWHTSSYNTNSNGSTDFGLLQINSIHWRGCGVTRTSLADPAVNARCARKIFQSQGLGAWYGYRNHKRICDNYSTGRVGGNRVSELSEDQIMFGDRSELDGIDSDMDEHDMNNGLEIPAAEDDEAPQGT